MPEIVWHYTGAAGLEGILRSRSLWASSIAHLNDAQEATFIVGELRDRFERMPHAYAQYLDSDFSELLQGRTGNGSHRDAGLDYCVELFLARCSDQIDKVILNPDEKMFATCFSGKGDDLSQWRAYPDPAPAFRSASSLRNLLRAARSGTSGNAFT
jgi:hypothetical protein